MPKRIDRVDTFNIPNSRSTLSDLQNNQLKILKRKNKKRTSLSNRFILQKKIETKKRRRDGIRRKSKGIIIGEIFAINPVCKSLLTREEVIASSGRKGDEKRETLKKQPLQNLNLSKFNTRSLSLSLGRKHRSKDVLARVDKFLIGRGDCWPSLQRWAPPTPWPNPIPFSMEERHGCSFQRIYTAYLPSFAYRLFEFRVCTRIIIIEGSGGDSAAAIQRPF